MPTAVFPTLLFDLFDPRTFFSFFFSWDRSTEPFVLHCFECLAEADFYQLYTDVKRLLETQVYSRHFSDFFYRHLILCNAIS